MATKTQQDKQIQLLTEVYKLIFMQYSTKRRTELRVSCYKEVNIGF